MRFLFLVLSLFVSFTFAAFNVQAEDFKVVLPLPNDVNPESLVFGEFSFALNVFDKADNFQLQVQNKIGSDVYIAETPKAGVGVALAVGISNDIELALYSDSDSSTLSLKYQIKPKKKRPAFAYNDARL